LLQTGAAKPGGEAPGERIARAADVAHIESAPAAELETLYLNTDLGRAGVHDVGVHVFLRHLIGGVLSTTIQYGRAAH